MTYLIDAFANIPNAILELKTKSAVVDPILNCNHKQKTVVSWSLNSETIINQQEHKTARLYERLDALKKVTEAGYLVGLHFDPVILHDNWEKEYQQLIFKTIKATNINQIAWISLGSLRFNPEMKQKIEENFPAATITHAEMILGDDGKMRYPKPLRLRVYKWIIDQLKEALNCSNLSPLEITNKPLFYFAWNAGMSGNIFLMKAYPLNLDYLFAKSLHHRFYPQFHAPNRAIYNV